jgi:hypothetical protein
VEFPLNLNLAFEEKNLVRSDDCTVLSPLNLQVPGKKEARLHQSVRGLRKYEEKAKIKQEQIRKEVYSKISFLGEAIDEPSWFDSDESLYGQAWD